MLPHKATIVSKAQFFKEVYFADFIGITRVCLMAKVLFVVSEDWYFVSHRLKLAIAIKDLGHDVVVAARASDCNDIIESSGIRLISLRHMRRSSLNFISEIFSIFELFTLFFREKPDLLHLVAIKPIIYGYLASVFFKKLVRVNALGGLGSIFSSNRVMAQWIRLILSPLFWSAFNGKSSRVIVQNEADYAMISEKFGVNATNIKLIMGAGVDTNEYNISKPPDGIPVVALASRMLWDKGVGEFVEAARSLIKAGIIARFVLVGSPDDENFSSVPSTQLHQWSRSGLVEWWGYKANMGEVFKQASIVCLPTYYGEGVPKVLIEGMSCGRPIVTTDMPGCADLVQGLNTGLLVPRKDAKELAKALKRLIEDRSLRELMGHNGRAVVEKSYSLDKVIKETQLIYDELLA